MKSEGCKLHFFVATTITFVLKIFYEDLYLHLHMHTLQQRFFFSAYLTMRVAVTKSTLQQQWKPPLVFAAVNHVANLQLLNNLAVMSKRQSALLQMRMIIFVAAKMECVGGSFGTAKLILSLENYAFFPSQLQKYSYDCKLQLQRLQNLCLHLQTPCIFAVTNVCSLELQYNFIAKCQYNCTRNVLWCQVHSSHIHANHKTSWNYNNGKQTSRYKSHS